jgi:hypothetical protein
VWEPHTAICCADNTNIPYLSIHWFWTFVDWEFVFISVKKSVTWRVERGRENAHLAFFYIRRVLLATELKRGKYLKHFRFSGGNGCEHIKGLLKPIFPLFLA